jgi:putative restriction endonuclease
MLVDREFADSQMQDVLIATGLGDINITSGAEPEESEQRRRSPSWPRAILTAWNKTCAFCGYSGMLGAATVGLEAAHIRWFKKGGPDEMDNGLALCALDHKLLDTGVLGVSPDYRIRVARDCIGIASAGERILQLHGRRLTSPKPGTPLPNQAHLLWHAHQVFKAPALLE